jgi:hypothetical protein
MMRPLYDAHEKPNQYETARSLCSLDDQDGKDFSPGNVAGGTIPFML